MNPKVLTLFCRAKKNNSKLEQRDVGFNFGATHTVGEKGKKADDMISGRFRQLGFCSFIVTKVRAQSTEAREIS